MGWTQVDPLFLRVPDLAKQSTPRRSNLGAFSLNNPVRYMDPDGRDSVSSGASSGAAGVCNQDAGGRCTMESGGADTSSGRRSSSEGLAELIAQDMSNKAALEAAESLRSQSEALARPSFCAECFIIKVVTGLFLFQIVGRFNDLDDSPDRAANAADPRVELTSGTAPPPPPRSGRSTAPRPAPARAPAPRATPTRFVAGAGGTVDLKPTLDRLSNGGTFPHPNDGSVFQNRPPPGATAPLLPVKPVGYYHEYVHPTPGVAGLPRDRSAARRRARPRSSTSLHARPAARRSGSASSPTSSP